MGLKDLNTPENLEEKDVLPGGGFSLFDTGVYDMTIKMAHTAASASGAEALHLRLEDAEGKEHREAIYYMSGKAKGNKTTYTDNRSGKELPLPGFTQANQIAVCATGNGLSQQDEEEKTIKLWDREAQAETPQKANVVMSLIGKTIKVGLTKNRANKQVQEGNRWVDGPDVREFNEIQKVFSEDGLTSVEIIAGKTEPEFLERWEEKFGSDYVNDTFKPVAGAPASEPAVPAPVTDNDIFGD